MYSQCFNCGVLEIANSQAPIATSALPIAGAVPTSLLAARFLKTMEKTRKIRVLLKFPTKRELALLVFPKMNPTKM
jgi:hypothetical protein